VIGPLRECRSAALDKSPLPVFSGTSPMVRAARCGRVGTADTGRVGPSVAHGEEPPGAGNTLEFVLAFVLETQVRSGN
jgi:hypothetical protein